MKSSTRNILWIIVLVTMLMGVIGYNYLYQGHRDIQAEEAVTIVTADSLQEMFSNDPSHEYLNQTITVNGVVSEITNDVIVLDEKVHCLMLGALPNLVPGSQVSIKGRCLGYDELFEIVKLDQCSIQKIQS